MQSDAERQSSSGIQGKDLVERLIDQDRFPEARIYANELLASSAADPDIYALLAYIEVNSGHFSVARRYMLEALRLAPESETAKENLAYLDSLEIQTTDHDYMQRWFVSRFRHMDYPRVIHLETVGRCNAKCSFCPHSRLARKFDAMSDGLFQKIVREVSHFPADRFVGFYMHAVNEPFMDRKIFERMSLINEAVPLAQIAITTNMNVMPPRFFDRIREIKQLSSWNVSFNAANRLEYESSMGIDFARTVANIGLLLEENRRSRFVTGPITLSRVGMDVESNQRFVAECQALFPDFHCGKDFEPSFLGKANWLGDIEDASPSFYHSWPCQQWTNLTIHCNGIVPHCCVDAKARFPFGDVTERSILEIYNSPHWRNLRLNVSGREAVYPCNTCNLR